MNLVTRWDPFREMEDLQKRLTSIFGVAPGRVANGKEDMTVAQWLPLVDITEDDREYLIKAELPEVRKEDVKVTVQDGVLTLAGERRQEKREDTEKLHRIERRYGAFERRFALPEDADEGSISAESRDGVLVIRVPKHKVAHPEPRQIQIQ